MRLVIDGFGKSIAKRDNQIVIKENKKEVDFFLAKDLEQIIVSGKGSVTYDALELLAENNVDFISIDWKGDLNYRLSSGEHKNTVIKKEQYYSLKDYRSGFLAKSFIKGKIENQKATLGTLAKSRKDNEEIKIQRDKLNVFLEDLNKINNRPSESIQSKILGIEGRASVEYWKGFKLALSESFGFTSRSGRYAQDPVNAMLNYAYAILQSEVWKSLNEVGLDSYCGFLHSDRYGRPSLVFDLIEEFRQQIVDKTVLTLINRKQVVKDDFEFKGNSVFIKDKVKKLIIKGLFDKFSSDITFNDKMITYSKAILNQARGISLFLTKKSSYEPFYLRW